MQKEIYLLLGSNLGDKAYHLERAIQEISVKVGKVTKASSVIETEAWGFESDSTFLNQAICIESPFSAIELLDQLQSIEKEIGREKKSNSGYESRIIDIDILFYGSMVVETDRLKIPHPLLQNRFFALRPLAEIAAHLVHPIFNKSIETMLREIVS